MSDSRLPKGTAVQPSEPALTTVEDGETRPLLGITFKVLSTIAFVVMSAMVKELSEAVPTGEIVFARNFAGMVPVLLMMAWQGNLISSMKTARPLGHFVRSVVGVTAMSLNFAALAFIPLPDATAISYAAPLLTVVLAVLVLGEVVRIYRWTAVGVGFFGVIIILYPHLGSTAMQGDTAMGAGIAFVATFFMAMAAIIVRKLILTERSGTIVLWFSASSSVLALLTLPVGWIWPSWAWVMPDATQLGLLVAVGLVGGAGQIVMTQSYRYADASTIAPFDYTTMIWATAVGWIVFSEVPGPWVVGGAALVISAGLFVIFREHRLGIDRTRAKRASSPGKM